MGKLALKTYKLNNFDNKSKLHFSTLNGVNKDEGIYNF